MLNIEFMFGVLAAWVVRGGASRVGPGWWMLAGTTLALSMLASITTENLPFVRLAFAFGLALIVVGFVLFERNTSLAWPAILLLIGNASYSIYLIHNPLLSVTQRIAGRLELGWLDGLIFGVVLCVLAGLGYYRLIERPALGFFRNRIKRA